MTNHTRRRTLTAAIMTPLNLAAGAGAFRAGKGAGCGPGGAGQAARNWFAFLAAERLDPRTHPGVVLVLHGSGAGLDRTPGCFEGREAVAAVMAGAGPARWDLEEVLEGDGRAAPRGTTWFPEGRAAAFAAFVTLPDGQVVRVERYLDQTQQQAQET